MDSQSKSGCSIAPGSSGSNTRLWYGSFIKPLDSDITSVFGTQRVFNGQIQSYHRGTDFRAKKGTPVYASNFGIVRLAKNLFYSGNVVIVDHGKVLVDGAPIDLIAEHAGGSVIEIEGPDQALRDHIARNKVPHDDLGRKLIVYTNAESDMDTMIRDRFCTDRCTFRSSSLEDVFLRLTGRELRE